MTFIVNQFPEIMMKFHNPDFEGINWFAWLPGEIKIRGAGESCDWELTKPNFDPYGTFFEETRMLSQRIRREVFLKLACVITAYNMLELFVDRIQMGQSATDVSFTNIKTALGSVLPPGGQWSDMLFRVGLPETMKECHDPRQIFKRQFESSDLLRLRGVEENMQRVSGHLLQSKRKIEDQDIAREMDDFTYNDILGVLSRENEGIPRPQMIDMIDLTRYDSKNNDWIPYAVLSGAIVATLIFIDG
jgi:hypothetical protein